jgi:hypothetical protein
MRRNFHCTESYIIQEKIHKSCSCTQNLHLLVSILGLDVGSGVVPPVALGVVAVVVVVAPLVVHDDLGGVAHGVARRAPQVLLELGLRDAALLQVVPRLLVVAVEAAAALRAGRVVRGDRVAVGGRSVPEVLCRAISALETRESS